MEEIAANGCADMVFVGRKLLRDPNFAFNATKQLGVGLEWSQQYRALNA